VAITEIQSRSIQLAGTTSSTLAYSSNVTNGSKLIVFVFDGGGLGTTIGVSDNLNGSYTNIKQGNLATDHDTCAVFYCDNTHSGSAPTVTVTGTGLSGFAIHEFTGLATGGLDQSAFQNTSGTSATSGNTGTTTTASELVFAAVGTSGSGDTLTAGTGYTQMENNPGGHLLTEYKVVSSTGAFAGTFTLSPSDEYAAFCCTFAATSGTQSFSYTAAGGMTFGGTGARNYVRQEGTRTGGLAFAGSSAEARVVALPARTGGLNFGGTGSFAKGIVQAARTGGLSFAGTSAQLRREVYTGIGGIVFAGSAPESSSGTQHFSYTASGGLVFGGTAAELRKMIRTAAGGLNFGGSAGFLTFIVGGVAVRVSIRRLLPYLVRHK
jgi:hypothetical protein